jgi:hypothetical protein
MSAGVGIGIKYNNSNPPLKLPPILVFLHV